MTRERTGIRATGPSTWHRRRLGHKAPDQGEDQHPGTGHEVDNHGPGQEEVGRRGQEVDTGQAEPPGPWAV